MSLIKVTRGCSPVQMSLIKVTRGSPVQMGNTPHTPPPQYDSWDRPPHIILVVIHTYMYAVDDICMWICLLCVYLHIRLYNNTDTCILYTIIATCA